LVIANELDLARLWWRFGGARSESGRFERLKLLRNLGERLIRTPGLAAFRVDELNSETVEELLHVDSLREDRAGATVAFGHDTLRELDDRLSARRKAGIADGPAGGSSAARSACPRAGNYRAARAG
jgi:hypothetical protein